MKLRRVLATVSFISVSIVAFAFLDAMASVFGLTSHSREIIYDFHRDELRNAITPLGIGLVPMPLLVAGGASYYVAGGEPTREDSGTYVTCLAGAFALLVLGGLHQAVFGTGATPSIASMVTEHATYIVALAVSGTWSKLGKGSRSSNNN